MFLTNLDDLTSVSGRAYASAKALIAPQMTSTLDGFHFSGTLLGMPEWEAEEEGPCSTLSSTPFTASESSTRSVSQS